MRAFFVKGMDLASSQLFYHALAHMGTGAVIICWTKERYISIGLHQDAGHELDMAACARAGLPVFRREVGGGTVFLDPQQVFYQVVVPKDDPTMPCDHGEAFKTVTAPVIEVLSRFGVHAQVRPASDLQVGLDKPATARKISGNAGGDIGKCRVIVGNVLLDFQAARFIEALPGPPVHKTAVADCLDRDITSMRRETGRSMGPEEVAGLLMDAFSSKFELGTGWEPSIPADVAEDMERLRTRYLEPAWTLGGRKRTVPDHHDVKVREGVHVVSRGESTLELREGRVARIWAGGDEAWEGKALDKALIDGMMAATGGRSKGIENTLTSISREARF